MAINGLEKITDKILAEAEAEANAILAAAEAEAKEITASYVARAEGIRAQLSEAAEREGKDLVARAKAGAANAGRDLLLRTEGELIDGVFDAAEESVRRMDSAAYIELLAGLLAAALWEEVQMEEQGRSLDDDYVSPACYEVLMSPKDRERMGAAVVASLTQKLSGKLSGEKLGRLRLSERTLAPEMGPVLVAGDIEINCTPALLMAQLRGELETEVSHALFGRRDKH